MTDESFNPDDIGHMKTEVQREMQSILLELKNDYPEVVESVGAALGAAGGGAVSFAALWGLGTTGLSAVGITSGLATAGGVIGGGMVAGIAVLAAPVALLGLGGYWLMSRSKKAKLTAALGVTIQKLYDIQNRLMQNAEYFKDEIASIQVAIQTLTEKQA